MVNRDELEEITDRNEHQTGRPESAPVRGKKKTNVPNPYGSHLAWYNQYTGIFKRSQSTDYKVIPTIYN